MSSRYQMVAVVFLTAGFAFVAADAQSFGADWITAPQLCNGKAYSETARNALWQFDREQRVSLATPSSGPMSTSRVPRPGADFVVKVRLRSNVDSECRLILGDLTLNLSNDGSKTRLVVASQTETIGNGSIESQDWTLLTIRRREGSMSAELNEQLSLELGSQRRVIDAIRLQLMRGTSAVSNFVVTGDLEAVGRTE